MPPYVAAFICFLFFVVFAANNWFILNFDKPWGMIDIDRYVELRNDYRLGDKVQNHILTIMLFDWFGDLWFTPLLFGLVFPVSVWFFYRSFSKESVSVFQFFLFFLGTFNFIFFWFTALYAQALACCCFMLGVGLIRHRHLFLGLSLLVLSCFFHEYMFAVYFLILIVLSFFYDRWLGVLLSVIGFFVCVKFKHAWVWSSYYTWVEPGVYMMLFTFTFPLVWFMAFLGAKRLTFWSAVTAVFCVVMPFITIGRGMFFSHLFGVFFAGQYLREVYVRRGWVVVAVVILLCCLWLNNIFDVTMKNMMLELPYRGLDKDRLKGDLGVVESMYLNLSCTKIDK